jgi:hypothetical protein
MEQTAAREAELKERGRTSADSEPAGTVPSTEARSSMLSVPATLPTKGAVSPRTAKKWGTVLSPAEKAAADRAAFVADTPTTVLSTQQQPPTDLTDPAAVKKALADAASAARQDATETEAKVAETKEARDSFESLPPRTQGRRMSIGDRLFPQSPSRSALDGGNAAEEGHDDDELEDLDPKAIAAAEWTDKEIRKLIAEIIARGFVGENGLHAITFKQLFDETDQIFDALSGICKTAKKYKIVKFDAEQLWQGTHDATIIQLLKETHDGVEIKRRKKGDMRAAVNRARKQSSGFGADSLATQNAKCHVCKKTVYQVEFVGASDKAFHKNCFRCTTCNCILAQNNYAVGPDSNFYCDAHNKELFMKSA